MGVGANHDTPCIKKILWCSIRVSYRCASEHWVLLCLVLLLYLLFKISPGLFAFLLSSSPVIICATLLLAVLISHGSTNCPEIDEDRKDLVDTSAPKSAGASRNIHCESQRKFSVPSFKENTVSLKDGEIKEACFGKVRADDSVPLLKEDYQENGRADAYDRLEETLTSIHSMVSMQQKVSMEEHVEANQDRESKDSVPSEDEGDKYANLLEVVHQSRVDENQTACGLHSSSENVRQDVEMMAKANHDRGSTGSQSDEVKVVSEDKPAGTCKWGRAFSVRQRKKLADIEIEAINANVDNQLDSFLGSAFGRVGSHDDSSGFHSILADITSPDTPRTDIAPVLVEIDPRPSADFSYPDPIVNNDSDNHLCMSSQDCKIDSSSNDEADKSQAKDNDEKNVGADPAFCTVDDDKNVMDLGYSEMERTHRLDSMMAKRRSRKNIIFEIDSDLIDVDNNQFCRRADDVVSFPVQVQTISVPRRNPFDITSCSDGTKITGSAPSVLHPRKNPFDYTFEKSDESDLHEHDNFGPHEFMEVSHRDMLFRSHESFNLGSQGKRLSRFKPHFVLDAMDVEEPRASDFQSQRTVTESDNISSVADQDNLSDCTEK